MRNYRGIQQILTRKTCCAPLNRLTIIPSAQAHTDPEELPPSFAENEPEKPLEKLNTSRLTQQHRNMLREELPYAEPHSWIHTTESYQRKMFGRYGLASNVNPRVCFPTKSDLANQAEYERVAFPHTVPQMIAINKKTRAAEQLEIQQREDEISRKLQKLEQWKKELAAKAAKKEADAQVAKDRKERLIEEVRRHFGFKVDPRDERFKEMLEQKEREDRKKTKEAKRKDKEDKMMAKITESVKGKTDKKVEKDEE